MIGIHVGIPNEAGPLNLYPWPSIVGAPRLWVNGNAVVLNAGSVRTWVDQGPEGNHIQQAAGASQPAYVVSDPNYGNKPTLNFVGNKWMASLAFALGPMTSPSTAYVVGHTSTSTADYRVFIDGINANRWIVTANVGTGLIYSYAALAINTDRFGSNPQIQCIYFNNAAGAHYVNAYQTPNVSGPIGAAPLDGITVGSILGGGSAFINGTIAEIIIFAGVHSTAQRLAMLAYLNGKYNQIVLATTRGLVGLYRSSLGITLGTGVQTWLDQSGYQHHLVQAAGAQQPALGSIGAFPAVTADGSNDFLEAAYGSASVGAQTIFHVSKWNVGPGVQSTMFDCSTGGVNNQNRFYRSPAGLAGMFSAGAGYTGVGINTTSLHVNTNVFNGAVSPYRQNGVEVMTGATALATNINAFRMFSYGGGADYAAASTLEAYVYLGAVPLIDMQAIEADLQTYYASVL